MDGTNSRLAEEIGGGLGGDLDRIIWRETIRGKGVRGATGRHRACT
jgi:hypothetical protein